MGAWQYEINDGDGWKVVPRDVALSRIARTLRETKVGKYDNPERKLRAIRRTGRETPIVDKFGHGGTPSWIRITRKKPGRLKTARTGG